MTSAYGSSSSADVACHKTPRGGWSSREAGRAAYWRRTGALLGSIGDCQARTPQARARPQSLAGALAMDLDASHADRARYRRADSRGDPMGRPPLAVGTFGTIRYERLGRNRVQASASFRDPDGRRRHVLRTGPTRAQADRLLREALRDRAKSSTPPLPADCRLSAMAALWLADVDASDPAIGTKRLYRFAVQSYVLPGLGELRLRELTVAAVDRLLTTVSADHGPAAAKSTRSVLSGILGLAVAPRTAGHQPGTRHPGPAHRSQPEASPSAERRGRRPPARPAGDRRRRGR